MSDREARKEEVLERLRTVEDPETGRDLVGLGWVRDVTHCEGAVKFTIASANPATRSREAVESAAKEAVGAIPWVDQVNLAWVTEVPSAARDENAPLASVKNIIAVASGKGGVGKSTMAVNLACGLAKSGAKVGLLDADIYGPSIPTMLGTLARPEAVDGPGGKKMFAPVEAHGVKLMSMGFLVEPDKPVIWRGPMLHGALKQFFGDVAWGELDFLVIDLPPGTGDVSLTMAQTINVTGAVVVSTPQEVAMVDARKALAMFKETSIPVLGIVENMSGEIFGEGEAKAWAETEQIRFLGSIPLAKGVREGGDAGVPAALSDDPAVSGPFSEYVANVAASLAVQHAEAPARKPISIKR